MSGGKLPSIPRKEAREKRTLRPCVHVHDEWEKKVPLILYPLARICLYQTEFESNINRI